MKFAKDAGQTLDVNEAEAEYLAKEKQDQQIEEIQERRRSSKANFLKGDSMAQMASLADVDDEGKPLIQKEPSKVAVTKVPTGVMAILEQGVRSETFTAKNQGVAKSVLKRQLADDREQEKRL